MANAQSILPFKRKRNQQERDDEIEQPKQNPGAGQPLPDQAFYEIEYAHASSWGWMGCIRALDLTYENRDDVGLSRIRVLAGWRTIIE